MNTRLFTAFTIIVILSTNFLFSAAAFSSGEIFKCTVNGKPFFTDKPCDGETVNLKKTNSSVGFENTLIQLPQEVYKSDKWYADSMGFREAKSVAEVYKVPMIIYFRTDWCSYCIAVDTNILAQPDAKKAIQGFVKVKINPEHGDAEMQLFNTMNGKGYPRFLVRTVDNILTKVSVTPGDKNKDKKIKNISVPEFINNISKF